MNIFSLYNTNQQLVLPIDLEIMIPETDSIRLLSTVLEGLDYSEKNIFIDGTKIEANSNKYSFVWKKSVDKFERKLKKKMIEKVNEINEEFGKCYATDSDSLNVTLYSEIIDDLNKIINENKE